MPADLVTLGRRRLQVAMQALAHRLPSLSLADQQNTVSPAQHFVGNDLARAIGSLGGVLLETA